MALATICYKVTALVLYIHCFVPVIVCGVCFVPWFCCKVFCVISNFAICALEKLFILSSSCFATFLLVICVIDFLRLACFRVFLLLPCGHLLGKG